MSAGNQILTNKGNKMRYLYSIDNVDMGESDKYGYFTNKQLTTFGDNLQELLDNAGYSYIDQDGGDVSQGPADDAAAVNYIEDWYRENKCPEMEHVTGLKDPMTVAKEYDLDKNSK